MIQGVESGSIHCNSLDQAGRILKAGPIRMLLADGEIRYLRYGRVELLRRIFVGIRDAAWGTVPGRIQGLVVEQQEFGFLTHFTMVHLGRGIQFRWNATISARASLDHDPPGVCVRYEMSGVAENAFTTNRTGLCIPHPIENCAGLPCGIEHADGSREAGRFPERIAPYPLFTNLIGMAYEPLPHLNVAVQFEGEVFECEDQRNWIDGSFKTYCRPLDWPIPYALEAGAELHQAVTVRITGRRLLDEPVDARNALRLSASTCWLPEIGLRIGPGDANLSAMDVERLRSLNLSHLRVDLDFPGSAIRDRLEAIARQAQELGLPIELALHLHDLKLDPSLVELARFVARQDVRVARILLYVDGQSMTPGVIVERVQRELGVRGQRPPVGGGTDGNFAELNRAWPDARGMEVLAYPVSPQVHATDGLSLMESLEALGETVKTARESAPGVPLAIGPVRFHRRPDPFAKGNAGVNPEPELPDPRQKSAFGAVWTLAAIRALAESGADFVSLYEITGPFGIMDDRGPFPVYHLLARLGELSGLDVHCLEVPDSLRETGLALRQGEQVVLLVGNLTGESRPIRLAGLGQFSDSLWQRGCLDGEPPTLRRLRSEDGQLEVPLGPWEVVVLNNERIGI